MRKHFITLIVLVAAAMVVSTMARAAGESKNQAPFTRLQTQVQSESTGEAKNDVPFTATAGAVPDVFERYAAQHPYGRGITVAATQNDDGGVQWRYVAGGASIGGLLVLIGLGGLQLRRRSQVGPVLGS